MPAAHQPEPPDPHDVGPPPEPRHDSFSDLDDMPTDLAALVSELADPERAREALARALADPSQKRRPPEPP